MKIQYKGIASEICRKIQKYKNEMFRLRHRSGSSAFGPRDVLDSSMSMQVSAEKLIRVFQKIHETDLLTWQKRESDVLEIWESRDGIDIQIKLPDNQRLEFYQGR